MKSAILIFFLFCTASAFANNDTKLGNMVAVEREVTDIYTSCINNIRGDTTKPSSFCMCIFPTITGNEFSFTEKFFVREKNSKCIVDGSLERGKIIITFGPKEGQTSLAQAKNCLDEALLKKNSLKFVVYTVE